ncbi:peptidylprolyl isomerase [Cyanobium sp. PCC 7001]|uniref:peptidylprolyl isomerase n=1 Tax=Cyanobium sp. PCC 7001 TaxID=180281 RepID=UPI0002E76BD1|nr:peptidylprolyl isomerase [Cyanobium sp. PCC 7001]
MDRTDLQRLARYGLLRPLLRQVILEEVLADVPVEAEEAEAAKAQFLEDHDISSQEELQQVQRSFCLSEQDIEYQALYPVKVWKYCHEHFSSKAESRFLARKSSLDQVVYSLLRTQNADLARELYLQVSEGEASFDVLAAAHAEGPERDTRGIVGPVPLSQGHPSLVERLQTASPGNVIEPFPIGDWWLLVRVERLIPACFDEEAENSMIQEMLDEWLEQEVDARMDQLFSSLASPPSPASVSARSEAGPSSTSSASHSAPQSASETVEV